MHERVSLPVLIRLMGVNVLLKIEICGLSLKVEQSVKQNYIDGI
jgi:hypothetical protein